MAKDALRFLNLPGQSSQLDCTCDILDKQAASVNYVEYMLDRTNCIFRYKNLPDTIPEYLLEMMLQVYGSVAIISVNNNLYAVRAEFGGPPDPYYRPTQAVVANPALNVTHTYRIDNYFPPFDDTTWRAMPPCIRIHNDTQLAGLLPLFTRYAAQMAENDVSIRSAQINTRQQTVIAATTGQEMESAVKYMDALEAGKLVAIETRPFMENVQVVATASGQSNIITQLIELQQYLKASWYNEIGLNSNFNMKRQYVSADEINSSADIMLPLIDNMFRCRLEALEKINLLFGTEISVEKDSAWAKKQMQSDLSVMVDANGNPVTSQDEQEIDESEVQNDKSAEEEIKEE